MSKLKIGALYLLLGAGGLWHLLGVFQGVMRVLASPMMFGLGIWLFWEYWQAHPKQKKLRFARWSIGVIVGSFCIEWLGVQKGQIFGVYMYGQTLRPTISGVPVCIGCAWFVMLISSVAVAQTVLPKSFINGDIKLTVCVSFLMVCFDLVMEPAAVMLDYWVWEDNYIPLQNYLAWFGLSFCFVMMGINVGLFSEPPPRIAHHFYFAQLIYFGLVVLKSL